MLYLICTTITSVDYAHYGVSRAKDWVSVGRGTIHFIMYSEISLLRPPKIKTTSILRPVFASPKWYFQYDIRY